MLDALMHAVGNTLHPSTLAAGQGRDGGGAEDQQLVPGGCGGGGGGGVKEVVGRLQLHRAGWRGGWRSMCSSAWLPWTTRIKSGLGRWGGGKDGIIMVNEGAQLGHAVQVGLEGSRQGGLP